MRAGTRLAPRRRVETALDPETQQAVPRGVELDLVDPVPEPVVCSKQRRVIVREPAPLERLTAE